jgi:hypothetical protein
MGSYVDVTGLAIEFLEFMGYVLVDEDDEFLLLNHKGDEHIIYKPGPRLLYVEDDNDVAIFKNRPRFDAPPADDPQEDNV